MIERDIKKLRAKMVRVFNRFIRLRDKNKGCISCFVGSVKHAGHYYSVSQCPQPAMRFNEQNVHGQCVTCNSFREGERQGYKKGLLKRYGSDIIMALDVKRSLRQNPWTAFEYETMIKEYEKKTDALLKNQ